LQQKPFVGKVVWVTGAGGGVGQATARMFAAGGANLVLNDRNEDRIAPFAREITTQDNKVIISAGDLRDPATAERTAQIVDAQLGRLDILVNCAGFNVANRRWGDVTPQAVDSVIETNLSAAFYCVTAAMPMMRRQGAGLLIHIASTDGIRMGTTGGPAYSASKHGLVAMSHSVNLEEAVNGLRSCVICPGGIDTPFLEHRANPPSAERRAILLRPSDVAEAIRYVASTPTSVRIDQITITPAI
jgi:NAD(P)-dependent dehydrogenase (short-subunit alcohol dehydrogenase family)